MIKQLQRTYFAMVDDLMLQTNVGMTKSEFHDYIKGQILPLMYDNDDYWDMDSFDITTNYTTLSTRWLTEEGYKEFIENFKSFIPKILEK